MSQTVKAVIARSKGADVEVVDIVVPDPGPGEALVAVETCGVCHTDLHYREGGINDEFPFLLGHEAAGRVEAVGEGVTNVEVIAADKELTLGACLNLGVDASDGKYVAKVDDDNFYGRHYLTDLLDCFTHSGAGIVGKWAHYTWLRSSGAVVLRFPYAEHRFEKLVQGGTIILDRDVVTDLRFGDLPRAVDTDILTRATEAGVRTWSGDRFNFVSVRGVDRHAHTWPIADTALMNRAGHVAFFGDPREHVEV